MNNVLKVLLDIGNDILVPGSLHLSSVLNINVIDNDILTQHTVINDMSAGLSNKVDLKVLDEKTGSYVDLDFVKILRIPHNNLVFTLWFNPLNKELILVPDLNAYYGMKYLKNTHLELSGYRVTFREDYVSQIPGIKTNGAGGQNFGGSNSVKCVTINIPNTIGVNRSGYYYEKMVTPELNYCHPSIFANGMIDLGKPSDIFSDTDFIAPISILGYSSIFEFTETYVGNRKLEDIGHLVIKLPM